MKILMIQNVLTSDSVVKVAVVKAMVVVANINLIGGRYENYQTTN